MMSENFKYLIWSKFGNFDFFVFGSSQKIKINYKKILNKVPTRVNYLSLKVLYVKIGTIKFYFPKNWLQLKNKINILRSKSKINNENNKSINIYKFCIWGIRQYV